MALDPSSPGVAILTAFLRHWQSPQRSSINAVISSGSSLVGRWGISRGDSFEVGGRSLKCVVSGMFLKSPVWLGSHALAGEQREPSHLCRVSY